MRKKKIAFSAGRGREAIETICQQLRQDGSRRLDQQDLSMVYGVVLHNVLQAAG